MKLLRWETVAVIDSITFSTYLLKKCSLESDLVLVAPVASVIIGINKGTLDTDVLIFLRTTCDWD